MTDILQVARELVAIDSVSRHEAALADRVEDELRTGGRLTVERVGDNVVARTSYGRSVRVVVAGHLDTVPSFGGDTKVEGETLRGLGSVDMKGGLAVMLALAAVVGDMSTDVTFVFYACEEIERSANGLAMLAGRRPELLAADAAVLVEPTGGVVEAGCQGTMRAVATVTGRRAHTARPQTGVNALHRLGELLRVVAGYGPRSVAIDGCVYTEQLQAVGVAGGVAGNVVPDRASVTVNHRFAPDRDEAAAGVQLRGLLAAGLDPSVGDSLEIVDAAAGAPPALDNPVLAKLVEATGARPRAKVGWTDVATFFGLGIPATNFGPGDPLLAHTPDEYVTRGELSWARDVLEGLLCSRT